jgi:predicted dehydrogenase
VGVIGLDINRADFYEKELSFQVSCSYGPGRYDNDYEQRGNDYPLAFVRWTEKRNFEAILSAIAQGRIDVEPLVSEVVELSDYEKIYGDIGSSRSIASILKYDGDVNLQQTSVKISDKTFAKGSGILGIIGAGNYAKATILPNLTKLKASIKYISSAGGLSGALTAKKNGIALATTNNQDMLQDAEVEAVIITTQHNTHAHLVLEALKAKKHVFVEKPLAINRVELEQIKEVYTSQNKTLTVGFNRRFSPFIQEAKQLLGDSEVPINVIATMNAGAIPANHWTQDMAVGGGRIIGEACHLIDLITYLSGSLVESVVMNSMGTNPAENTDNATILLKYQNGSTGVINYFANGSKAYSKERVEIYSQEKTIVIDNFRKAEYFGFKKNGMSKSQDKGHFEQFSRFIERLKTGGDAIIPFEEIYNTSSAAIAAVESLQTGSWIKL